MRLNSKIISEHQSVTCLDIPSQLLTVTNVSISQRKRMIAPGGSCSIVDVIYSAIGIVSACVILSGAMCFINWYCSRKSQEKAIVGNRNASEADRGAVSVTTMPIADAEESFTHEEETSTHENKQDTVIQISADSGETPSPRRHRRHHRHHHRRDKEDTVIQISTDTSQEGNASPGYAGDI